MQAFVESGSEFPHIRVLNHRLVVAWHANDFDVTGSQRFPTRQTFIHADFFIRTSKGPGSKYFSKRPLPVDSFLGNIRF